MIDSARAAEGHGNMIAPRLESLFQEIRNNDTGKPFTNEEIATKATSNGYPVTAAYIAQMRRGVRRNPTVNLLEGLASAFEVAPSYFFTEENVQAALDDAAVRAVMDSIVIRDIALRSAQLSPEGAQTVAGMLRNLQDMPGVTSYDPSTDDHDQ